MPAEKAKLVIEQGADYMFTLTRKYPDGSPMDFTGYTGKMQIRKAQGASVLVEATTANSKILIPVGSDGKVIVKLSGDDTKLLRYTSCVYDLKVISAAGDKMRLLQGAVSVSPEITQEPGDPVVTR